MINNPNRMEGFLNSDEYKAWQKSLFDTLYLKMDEEEKDKLRIEFENNLLFVSIKLGSYYPKKRK